MADIYVLDMNKKGDTLRCAFHIPIADVNNFAGMSYRTALVEYLDSTVSEVPNIAAATQTALDNGELFERVEQVRFSANDSNSAKWTAVQAAYTARKSKLLSTIQDRLEFWSHSGNE